MFEPVFVERTRRLPYHGKIDVQLGDWVQPEQVIGHLDYLPGRLLQFDAAKQVAVAPSELKPVMLKEEGDPVAAGEPVAMTYRFGECLAAVSPYSGYIGLVSRHQGKVFVREPVPVGSSEPVVIDLIEELGLNSLTWRDSLLVREGMAVHFEQPIAMRRGTPKSTYVLSPVYGRITGAKDGKVYITPLHTRTDLTAWLSGKVVKVQAGQEVTIRAYAHVVLGAYGIGGEAGGLLYVAAGPQETLPVAAVDDNWRQKVVVAGATASVDLLRAAQQAQAAAVVVGYMPFALLADFMSGDVTVGFTGDEDLGFTIILTEGFLPSQMAEGTFRTLQQLEGRYASVNGTTHIRAGVIRPEIIVCEPEQNWPVTDVRVGGESSLEVGQGSLVKLLREPRRGAIGRVLELPKERQVVASGASVLVARVQLQSGEEITVPIANLQVLEEGVEGNG
ncbi:MAG: hypothetical protein GX060_03255 [Firmicutes bacterium]|nr:hypothetical protein [Bacillota bacterium]